MEVNWSVKAIAIVYSSSGGQAHGPVTRRGVKQNMRPMEEIYICADINAHFLRRIRGLGDYQWIPRRIQLRWDISDATLRPFLLCRLRYRTKSVWNCYLSPISACMDPSLSPRLSFRLSLCVFSRPSIILSVRFSVDFLAFLLRVPSAAGRELSLSFHR